MKITLEPAYILHSRPFNETSVIVDALALNHGRVSLVAKGARAQKSRFRGILRSFTPLLLSWSGRSELMTLTGAECRGAPIELMDSGLLSGMYLNELLMRLLPKSDDHPDIFCAYEEALPQLILKDTREKSLRLFEKTLLTELGYGLSFQKDALDGETILAHEKYVFFPGRGFVKNTARYTDSLLFHGEHLLAFGQEILEHKDVLMAAKQLMRIAFAHLLDHKPLKTRDFFRGVAVGS